MVYGSPPINNCRSAYLTLSWELKIARFRSVESLEDKDPVSKLVSGRILLLEREKIANDMLFPFGRMMSADATTCINSSRCRIWNAFQNMLIPPGASRKHYNQLRTSTDMNGALLQHSNNINDGPFCIFPCTLNTLYAVESIPFWNVSDFRCCLKTALRNENKWVLILNESTK